jgi:hypothetical protein
MYRIKSFTLPFLLLCSALYLSACHPSSDKVELKLNFQPGDAYLYTITTDQTINSMGLANVKMNFTMEMKYELLSKEDSIQKLGVTYSHLAMQGSSPMGKMSYDSDHPDANPKISEMGKMVGKTFYVYLNPDGTLKKVEGLSALMDTTLGREAMKMPVSDSSFTMMMQNAFDLYPGKPVAVGESWERNTTMGISSFKFNMKSTYTLQSVKDGIADISVNSDLKLPETIMNKMNQQKGFEMKMEMDGRQKGSMKVDIVTGRIISGETTQDIEGKMKMGGQDMLMTIKGVIHTKSKKL